MRRREFASVIALETLLAGQKTRHYEAAYNEPGRTASPVTYIIDYTVDHLANAGYLKTLGEAPPQFLHVGQGTPFAGASGPVVVTKELTYVGLNLLTPKELRARIQSIKKFVASVHAAGVERVFPYICNQTIAGDPEKRLGFWDFYDHWNDYQEFGIPPKPLTDPLRWMQRDAAGHVHFNYAKAHERYVPQSRWAPCPNNEYWRGYLEFITEQVAGCGHDSIFVDNNTLHCYCAYCQKAFQRYLLGR